MSGRFPELEKKKIDFQGIYEDVRKAYPDAVLQQAVYTGCYMDEENVKAAGEVFQKMFPGSELMFGLYSSELPDGSLDTVTVVRPNGKMPTMVGLYDRTVEEDVLEIFELIITNASSRELFEEVRTLPGGDILYSVKEECKDEAVSLTVQQECYERGDGVPEYYITCPRAAAPVSFSIPERIEEVMRKHKVGKSRMLGRPLAPVMNDGLREKIDERMDR